MDAPKEVKRVPLVVYSNGERHVVGWAEVDLDGDLVTTAITNDDSGALPKALRAMSWKDWSASVNIDVSTKDVVEVNYGLSKPRYVGPTKLSHSQLIHPSHKMVSFSDVPWGCRTCGACECHHLPHLIAPCIDPYDYLKEGIDAG